MLSYDTGNYTLIWSSLIHGYSEGKFTTEYHQILAKHTLYIIPSLDSEMMYLWTGCIFCVMFLWGPIPAYTWSLHNWSSLLLVSCDQTTFFQFSLSIFLYEKWKKLFGYARLFVTIGSHNRTVICSLMTVDQINRHKSELFIV